MLAMADEPHVEMFSCSPIRATRPARRETCGVRCEGVTPDAEVARAVCGGVRHGARVHGRARSARLPLEHEGIFYI